MTARREFFEQEAAMYREAPTEVYGFRPTPRKSWWQRLVDWWRGARQAVGKWLHKGTPKAAKLKPPAKHKATRDAA